MIFKSTKGLRNVVIAILLIIAILGAIMFGSRPKKDYYGNYVIEDDYIVKENQYQSFTGDVTYEFPNLLEENGKKYKLLDAKSSSNYVGYTKPYIHTVKQKAVSEQELNIAQELTVDFNGSNIQVYLTDSKIEDASERRNPIRLTGYTDYNGVIGKPKAAKTKTIDYHDEVTGKTQKVVLKLDEVVVKSQPRWVSDLELPLTFIVYGADYYVLYDEKIPHNEEAPDLQGKEELILKMVNLDSSSHRIESYEWKGGEYEKDGIKKRDALAHGSRYVADYRANYVNNEVNLPKAEGITAHLTYQSKENLVGDIVYDIYVKGVYAPVNNTLHYLFGAFLLLLFAVIILYVIANKNEKRSDDI